MLIFEASVQVNKDYLDTEFYLESELMFIDFSGLNSKDPTVEGTIEDAQTMGVNHANNLGEYIDKILENSSLLKKVSTSKFKILEIPQTINEYFPISFDQQYFCQFHCTMHSTLIGYQFKNHKIDPKLKKLGIDFYNIGEYFFKDKFGELPDEIDISKYTF